MFYRGWMWELCGWRPWDMERVWLQEYVDACTSYRELLSSRGGD